MKTKLLFKTLFMISLISYCNNSLCAEIKDEKSRKIYCFQMTEGISKKFKESNIMKLGKIMIENNISNVITIVFEFNNGIDFNEVNKLLYDNDIDLLKNDNDIDCEYFIGV